jgi:PhnB protein
MKERPKMSNVNPIPSGYHTVTPYLIVADATEYIKFLKDAFDANETYRMDGPDGRVAHAEIRIGDSMIMLGGARGEWQPTTSSLYLYVEDCDALYEQALRAGGTSIQKLTTHFYGDRSGGIKDAAGNTWWIATRKEEVSPDEIQRRLATVHA